MSDQPGTEWWRQPDNPAYPPQEHPESHAPHSSSVTSGNQESSGLEKNPHYRSFGRRRLPEGIWYPLISLLSFGLLTSIPFFHAYRRLRDRGLLVQAFLFSAVTIQLMVVANIHSPPGWLQSISTVLIFYPLIVGTARAVSLRRRVYLGAAKAQAPETAIPDTWQWWVRGGFWYPLLPLLSFGLLTSVPFFHAYRRLRDRDLLVQAFLFSAMAISFVVIYNITNDLHSLTEWQKLAAVCLALFPLFAGMTQVGSLRRRVYLRIPQSVRGNYAADEAARADIESRIPVERQARVISDEAARADIESRIPVERQARVIGDWAGGMTGALIIFVFAIAMPVAGIAVTLTGRRDFLIDSTDIIYNSVFILMALGGAVALKILVTVKFTGDEGILQPLAALVAGLIVNIYLGFSIWLIAIRVLHPAASPHKLGLMVWWNLFDSIPFVNVNSALDWEQPMTEYGAGVGWLFLFQRIILLLTLARVIKLLVDRWIDYSKQKPSTSGDRSRPIARP
jgi:hypothetical protein